MSRVVLLDAGPLGMVTNPRASAETTAATEWLEAVLIGGSDAVIPEIADYEVRRELLRARRMRGVARLDALRMALRYLPLTTEAMLLAAEFWAHARRQGQPTASNASLDGDVILAAQAAVLAENEDEVVIATTNVGHLSRFTDARLWREIT